MVAEIERVLSDTRGYKRSFAGKVCGFLLPYWGVRYLNSDLEELHREQVNRGATSQRNVLCIVYLR